MSNCNPYEGVDFARKDSAKNHSFLEQVTRIPGDALIRRSRVVSATNAIVFDNATGTGVVASLIYEQVGDKEIDVLCGDLSHVMAQSVEERIAKEGWKGAKAHVIDARVIRSFHCMCNFSIVFIGP